MWCNKASHRTFFANKDWLQQHWDYGMNMGLYPHKRYAIIHAGPKYMKTSMHDKAY